MNKCTIFTWSQIGLHLQTQSPGTRIRLKASQVEHPQDAGMVPGIALPIGQRTDYRIDIGREHRLAVQDFGSHYEACLERIITPSELEKALKKSPGSTVLGATALGALLGVAIGRTESAALTGALIGGLAAIAGASLAKSSNPESPHQPTEDSDRSDHRQEAVSDPGWPRDKTNP